MKKKNYFSRYTIGILIALGFYIISMFLGSVINVLISFTAGYSSWSSFLASENITGLILILIIGLFNHVFISWVTTNILLRYGKKNDCVTRWLFNSAAIAVLVFALVIVPVLFSSESGWFLYLSHALGIALFGRAKFEKNQKTATGSLSSSSAIVAGQTECDIIKQTTTQPMNDISTGNNSFFAGEETNKAKELSSDYAYQLRQLKNLVDDGIITQEEFDLKKKQLLEL